MARIPYVDPDELPEEYRDLVVSELQGKRINVYSALGNNPEVLAGMRAFLASLWESTGLTERERELVILSTAAGNENRYEWHQHVRIGRDAGVTETEMAALADGEYDGFDRNEALLLRYAEAVLERDVDDALHDAFVDARDESTAVGVASLVNGYSALAGVLDAFDVGLEESEKFAGWDPRT